MFISAEPGSRTFEQELGTVGEAKFSFDFVAKSHFDTLWKSFSTSILVESDDATSGARAMSLTPIYGPVNK